MLTKDLLHKTEPELLKDLENLGYEGVNHVTAILQELTRRSVKSLVESSGRLELLTKVLIALTVVLLIVAVPSAIDSVCKLLRH